MCIAHTAVKGFFLESIFHSDQELRPGTWFAAFAIRFSDL
jgi:hypothetical protein